MNETASPPGPNKHPSRVAQDDRLLHLEIRGDRITLRPPDRRRRPLAERQAAAIEGRPFLKWAGGKQWLARVIQLLVPPAFNGYYEPFLGGGSVYFALAPETAHLTDANDELIRTFIAIRDEPDDVITHLRPLRYDADVFERVRARRPRKTATAAARFIYLNRTAFNGIYRVNRAGNFNVPFGSFTNPIICDEQRLGACSLQLSNALTITTATFEAAVKTAAAGDLVYFDPPYITGHMNNGFVKWNAKLFRWEDQELLARVAAQLKARGVHVLVSNADHPAVTGLYRGFNQYRLTRTSQIGGPRESRRPVTEALISSYPILGEPSPVGPIAP